MKEPKLITDSKGRGLMLTDITVGTEALIIQNQVKVVEALKALEQKLEKGQEPNYALIGTLRRYTYQFGCPWMRV